MSEQGRQFKLVQCKKMQEDDDCTLWMEVDPEYE